MTGAGLAHCLFLFRGPVGQRQWADYVGNTQYEAAAYSFPHTISAI